MEADAVPTSNLTSFTLTIGQLAVLIATVSGPLLAILLWLMRIERKMNNWMIEHEMMVIDYAKRQGIEVKDLPTRRKNW